MVDERHKDHHLKPPSLESAEFLKASACEATVSAYLSADVLGKVVALSGGIFLLKWETPWKQRVESENDRLEMCRSYFSKPNESMNRFEAFQKTAT